MNKFSSPKSDQSLYPILCIMPGATRSQDDVVVFDPQNYAAGIACSYMDYPSLEALKDSSIVFDGDQRLGQRFLEIAPLAEDDPLVQSKLTSYVALGDASVYKMVKMTESLVYVRKLPAVVDAEVLAQGRAIYAEAKRSQNLSAEPVESASDAQNKDEGMISRAWNFMRTRGG